MVEKSLKDFLSNIAPYLKLWAALRVSGVAVNLDGTWSSFQIKLMVGTTCSETNLGDSK